VANGAGEAKTSYGDEDLTFEDSASLVLNLALHQMANYAFSGISQRRSASYGRLTHLAGINRIAMIWECGCCSLAPKRQVSNQGGRIFAWAGVWLDPVVGRIPWR
jgi:hypothetical protein